MIVKTYSDVQILWAALERGDKFVVDIETTGLSFRKGALIMGIGICNYTGTESFYLPVRRYDLNSDTVIKLPFHSFGKQLCEKLQGKKIITWNAAFDLPFLEHEFGVPLLTHLWVEGMLLKHCVDEYRPFALKEVAASLFGHDVKNEQQEMQESIKRHNGSPKEYYKAEESLLAKYCEQDCVLTSMCVRHYMPLLQKEGLEKFYFEEEVMPLYREVTIPMEQFGVQLDMPLLQQSKEEINQVIEQLETEIQSEIAPHLGLFTKWYLNKEFPLKRTGAFAQKIAHHAGLGPKLPKTKAGRISLNTKSLMMLDERTPEINYLLNKDYGYVTEDVKLRVQQELFAELGQRYIFNLSSKHHLKKLFFETLDEKPLSRTEKGSPQVDDDFISSLHNKYDWCRKLTEYNKLIKIRGTYIERFLEEQINGRFYPRFLQHGTISGRYGSDLQQLPRPTGDDTISAQFNDRIRKFFVSDPDWVFIDADYESLEPKVFASVSGDERLQNIFREGMDFYSEIAIRTEKLQGYSSKKSDDNFLGALSKQKRQKAKSYSLGIPYGMSGYKLSFELGCSVEEADKLVNDYLNAFPDLKAWMEATKKAVLKDGKVKTLAGRVRHMPEAVGLFKKYGPELLDSLEVWKAYKRDLGDEKLYLAMMERHKLLKNYINNGNNFQIQSLSASIVNRAAIGINRFLKFHEIPGTVVCQIHDQIITAVPVQHAEFVRQGVQQLMESAFKLAVPLLAPAAIATNFYEGH